MSDRTQSYASRQSNERDEIAVIVSTIDKQQQKFADILPSDISWADFRNAFLTAVQMNWRLIEADRQSLWLALQRAAADGLKPDGREGALVIYGDDDEDGRPSSANAKKKVVWMPMVAGLIKLVRNTGDVAGIRAKLVYRGERVEVTDADGKESYRHVRVLDDRSEIDDSPANIVGAYAVVNYKDSTWEMEAMSRRQIERVKAVSRAKKGPWLPWYDEMAKKTVLRRLIKRLSKSKELAAIGNALDNDVSMTIEGVAEPAAPGQAVVPVDVVRAEFTPERQRKPEPAPKVERARPVVVAPPPEPKPEPPAEFEPPLESPVDALEVWAVDVDGEAVGVEPMTAMEFAHWFAARINAKADVTALTEHNADAMAEAGADPIAREIIRAALEDARAPRWVPTAQPAVAQTPKPIPVPKTPRGAADWPRYFDAVERELAGLTTVEAAGAWAALNRPTYEGKSIQIKVENRLHKLLMALVPPNDPPPPDDPAETDADEALVFRVKDEISYIETASALVEWARGPIRPLLAALKARNPDAYRRATEAAEKREVALSARP